MNSIRLFPLIGLFVVLQGCSVEIHYHAGEADDDSPVVQIEPAVPPWVNPRPDGAEELRPTPTPVSALVAGDVFQASNELLPHSQGIRDAVLSPDMQFVYTASEDGTAKKWSIETGTVLCTMNGHFGDLFGLDVSPDGTRLVTASRDSDARVWDTETGEMVHLLDNHREIMWEAAFSPDGKRIATVSGDRTVRLWNAVSGEEERVLHPEQWSYSCHFSQDGQLLATGHHSTSIVWNVATGEEVKRMGIGGHQNYLQATAFSPDGKTVATGGLDRAVTLWDVSRGTRLHQFSGHSGYIEGLAFSHNGDWLLSCGGGDRKAFLWDVQKRELVYAFNCQRAVQAVGFSSEDTHILLGLDNEVQIYHRENGERVRAFPIR